MAGIPVYGLNGFDTMAAAFSADDLGKLCGIYTAQPSHARGFHDYVTKINNSAHRMAVVKRHANELQALNGIYTVSYNNITNGRANKNDFVNLKKCEILLALNEQDFNAYRFAKIIMPYVTDIDDEGGYYFDLYEIAKAAAEAEEKFFAYADSPAATEYGIEQELASLDGWFKNIVNAVGNATKAVGKAVANTVVAPVKATVKATKAAYNVTKSGVQFISGNKSGAKESLQKAWNNMKDSVVEPIVTAAKDTRDVFKTNVVDITKVTAETTRDIFKSTIKVAGKLFKVLFLKINPVTVLIRSSLRGLISLNFIGMASRLNVGLMTEAQAKQQGYGSDAWAKAKKALERLTKLFVKMGGNKSKLLKSITNGASKKPLFKKDIANKTADLPTSDDGEATLGDPVSIAASIASCLSILVWVWQQIAKVVKEKKAEKQAKTEQERLEQEQKKQEEQLLKMKEKYAHNDQGEFFTDENGNFITWEQYDAMMAAGEEAASDEKKKQLYLIVGGVAVAGIATYLLSK